MITLKDIKKLPPDIEQHILEFNVYHRPKLKKNFNYIYLISARKRLRYLKMLWNMNLNENYPTMPINWNQFLNFYIPDPEIILKNLSLCRCCLRHQTNRPSNVDDIIKINYIKPFNQKKKKCLCDCRHICRRLVQIIKNDSRNI